MLVKRVEYLVKSGKFAGSREFTQIYTQITEAITSISWPKKTGKFEILPERKGNGVKPIKQKCMHFLKAKGWKLEERLNLGSRLKPGPIDAVFENPNYRKFAFEWETGNISSSHRALNKMALGMINGVLAGGILVVPSRELYQYLTDRIGNFPEIEPYFPLWKSMNIEGVLGVIEIEYDSINPKSPAIPKGTDGRALR